jgi:hypothetical protein
MNDPALEDILVDDYRPEYDSRASIVSSEIESSEESLSLRDKPDLATMMKAVFPSYQRKSSESEKMQLTRSETPLYESQNSNANPRPVNHSQSSWSKAELMI